MADMEVAIGIGQGGGNEELTRHGEGLSELGFDFSRRPEETAPVQCLRLGLIVAIFANHKKSSIYRKFLMSKNVFCQNLRGIACS
jgi:hypothetical protein